ncbi:MULTISPECIES: hypothetical protein [unclassified Microcoleus]
MPLSFAVSACGLVARPTYKQKIARSSIPNCAIVGRRRVNY